MESVSGQSVSGQIVELVDKVIDEQSDVGQIIVKKCKIAYILGGHDVRYVKFG